MCLISLSELRRRDPPESSAVTRTCETCATNVKIRHRDLLQFCQLSSRCANVFPAAIDALGPSTLAHGLPKSNASPPVPKQEKRLLPKTR
jgi:hypothetical protein